MALIKYENLNDVQSIIYDNGLTLEAVTKPMINNGLNVLQLKGKPDKDGRYFDLQGNKIHASRCWASSISGNSLLAEPYNAFSEKARSWSSMYGDEEPCLYYSRAYFDYKLDENGNKVHEWVTEGMEAEVKYVSLDIPAKVKHILHQVIVEGAAEMDGSFEEIVVINKADLLKDEVIEVPEDKQGNKYIDFRFRFIKMTVHKRDCVLVNSAMLLREAPGKGMPGNCSSKKLSFKIGDRFLEEHPNGIGQFAPSADGDETWRYVQNLTVEEIIMMLFDGQPLPKKMPIPLVKLDNITINNADCGGENAKNEVTAEFDVPAHIKARFYPALVIGSGDLEGKLDPSCEEIVKVATMSLDNIEIPEDPDYTVEIDGGEEGTRGRITVKINAKPNDVGAVHFLEGCVKYIVEEEGKYQMGETSNKPVKKEASYNGNKFHEEPKLLLKVNGKEISEMELERGIDKLDFVEIELIPNDCNMVEDDLVFMFNGKVVEDIKSFQLELPTDWKACDLGELVVKGESEDGCKVEAKCKFTVPECKMFFDAAALVDVNAAEDLPTQGLDYVIPRLIHEVGPIEKRILEEYMGAEAASTFLGNYMLVAPVESKVFIQAKDGLDGDAVIQKAGSGLDPKNVMIHGVEYKVEFIDLLGGANGYKVWVDEK